MNISRVIQQDDFYAGRGPNGTEQFRPTFRFVIGQRRSSFDWKGVKVSHLGRYLVSDYGSEVTLRFGRTLVRGEIGMVIVIGCDR